MRGSRSEVFLNAVLAICAMLFAALLVRREFVTPSRLSASAAQGPPTFIADWRTLESERRMFGDATAPIRIIEFVDFECPFCKRFAEELHRNRKTHPSKLAVSIVHFPLPSHRFARLAAYAADCALSEAKFPNMHDVLLAQQESLGVKSWSAFAVDAGITDTLAFQACMRSGSTARTIEDQLTRGRQLGVNATPTVILNGWKLPVPPSESELADILRKSESGKPWVPAGVRH